MTAASLSGRLGSAPRLASPAKERMAAGELALGLIVRVARTPDIARIARATDHDFLFIDGQHAAFTPDVIAAIAYAAHGCGIAPMVRVRSFEDPSISLCLDMGVTGIIVPDVSTAEEARAAVRACKFPPVGKRSMPGPLPLLDFAPIPGLEAARMVNDATLLVCMIETLAGVENAQAIAAVEGVDVLHVGCVDLLVAMGKPDAFGEPDVMAAVEHVIAAALGNGKFAGFGGDRDPGRQAHFVGKGARFMTTQTDVGLLLREGARVTTQLRAIGKP